MNVNIYPNRIIIIESQLILREYFEFIWINLFIYLIYNITNLQKFKARNNLIILMVDL